MSLPTLPAEVWVRILFCHTDLRHLGYECRLVSRDFNEYVDSVFTQHLHCLQFSMNPYIHTSFSSLSPDKTQAHFVIEQTEDYWREPWQGLKPGAMKGWYDHLTTGPIFFSLVPDTLSSIHIPERIQGWVRSTKKEDEGKPAEWRKYEITCDRHRLWKTILAAMTAFDKEFAFSRTGAWQKCEGYRWWAGEG